MARLHFSRLYHLAEEANMASIDKHGLMSAAASLERLGLPLAQRECILRAHRPKSVIVGPGTLLRDQAPMPPHALAAALTDGWTPEVWYRLLNGFVFFWVDPARVERQRKACGDRQQVLLTFDAESLLDSFGESAFVSPINSGNARRKPAPRGPATLMPYAQWRVEGWPTGRRWRPPAEVLFTSIIPAEAPYLIERA